MALWEMMAGVSALVFVASCYLLSLWLGSGPSIAISTNMTIHPERAKLRGDLKRPPTVDPLKTDFALDLYVERNFLPSCARDVFVALLEEGGGEREVTCRGLLVSDDIIVTSRECSGRRFTFHLADLGIVRAIPHGSLNSKEEMMDSRLGFLEARPPPHYIFDGDPVRRTLVFLSKRPHPNADNAGSETAMSCVGRRPVAHSFPVGAGDMVPLGRLAGILPDDILWDETDMDTAIAVKEGPLRWWTRPTALEEEDEKIRELLEEFRGPPGSISIPDSHSKFVKQASRLLEVVDPRGHRHLDCFPSYFVRYREETPFSGMHFFDWLDFGRGRSLLERNDTYKEFDEMKRDQKCHREDFERRTVHYFNDEERREHEVYLAPSEDGTGVIARYKRGDAPVRPTHEGHPHLYMWDLNRTLYVVDDTWDNKRYGRIVHTAVLAGRPALSAGMAYFGANGAMTGINWDSGHYQPDIRSTALMYRWFKDHGLNVTSLSWMGRLWWEKEDCKDGYANWDEFRIPGYDSEEVRQACFEVTSGPMWENGH